MTTQHRAYVLALGAVFAWSTVATAFKISLREVDTWQLLFYANLSSTVFLGLILVFRSRSRDTFWGRKRDYARSAALGFLNPFLYYAILFEAYDRLPAQEAQPLNYTWALTLPVLAVPLLGQRLTVRDAIALLVGYGGVVVIATRGDVLGFRLSDPLGVLLALGSAVVWAFFWILNARDEREPVVCLFLSFLTALPLTLVACILFSSVHLSAWDDALGPVYVGAFEMSVTFVLWLKAMRLSSSAARISTLIFISPFLSLVFIATVLGERIMPSTLAGLAMIVLALLYQKLGGNGRRTEHARRSA